MNDNDGASAPWHLWAVGILGLLWNGFGAYDYLMSVTRNQVYLANFPPEITGLLDTFPVWAMSAWAIGVWSSVLGSILLLLRSAKAEPVFLVSLACVIITFIYQMTLDVPASVREGPFTIMPFVVMAMIVLQLWYARKQAAAGVLK